MSAIEHYRTLKQRKQSLLVESDLNRLVLQLELEHVRGAAGRLDATLASVRKVGPWLLPLVSLAGVFAGGRARKVAGKSGGWIRMALRTLPVLLHLRGTRKRDD